jgi:hypothetical protein
MLRFTLLVAFSVLGVAQAGAGAPAVDHLLPWDGEYGFETDLRPLVDKKLVLTPADCGRMVRMHQHSDQGGIGESAVSVFCTETGCHVTLTRATRSLGMLWAEHRGERKQAALIRSVPVNRKDAAIPKSTAHAFRECLRAALRGTRKMPDTGEESIVLDNDRVEFWLVEGPSATLKAERPNFPGKNVESLIGLGDRLARYCEMSPPGRAAAAKEIEREAVRLQEVFSRKTASNHPMERTLDRCTLHF